MLSIRQKLSLGFGGLLAILIAVSLISASRLNSYSGTLDRIFRENYDSVTFSQGMRDALDKLDDYAEAATRGESLGKEHATAIQSFEQLLHLEEGNVTLPGELETVNGLKAAWTDYQSAWQSLLQEISTTQRAVVLRSRLQPISARIAAQLQQIIDLNLNNIVSVDGQVRLETRNAKRTLYASVGAGILLAVLFVGLMGRTILKPLQALTKSAREIEQGNLDLVVPVRSRDEVGQLAEAFNAMASKLREFRRSDRAKLVRAQRTTLLAVRSLPDAVAMVSADGHVELSNDSAQRYFALKADTTPSEWQDARLNNMYRQARDSEKQIGPGGYDTALQVFDDRGIERFFLPQAIPILDAGELVGVTLVLADVTNLRKLDEMKSGLLSVVSHELKTPLTSIRMASHLLLEERVGPLNAKQAELLTAARDDSERLHSIIERLLDMGRMESGQAQLELRSAAPASLIDTAVAEYSAAYRDKGVTLATNTAADLPTVLVDIDRIGHVFGNLLSNALRYTASGGTVELKAETTDAGVMFSVIDNGIGIAAQHVPHLFDRFYRVPGQPGQSGAGLGLAIAKDIVEAHGSHIDVTSNVGVGTRFSFTLSVDANTNAARAVSY